MTFLLVTILFTIYIQVNNLFLHVIPPGGRGILLLPPPISVRKELRNLAPLNISGRRA